MNNRQGIKVVMDTCQKKQEFLSTNQHLSINIYFQNPNSDQISSQGESLNLFNFLSLLGLEPQEVESIVQFLQFDGITTIEQLIRLDQETLESYQIPYDLLKEYDFYFNRDLHLDFTELGITKKEQLNFLKAKQVKNLEQLFQLTRKDILQLQLDQQKYLEAKQKYFQHKKFNDFAPSPLQCHQSLLSTQNLNKENEFSQSDQRKSLQTERSIIVVPRNQFTEYQTPQPQSTTPQTDQVNDDIILQLLNIINQGEPNFQILHLEQEVKSVNELLTLLSKMKTQLTFAQQELLSLIQRLHMFIEQEYLLIQSLYQLIEFGITNLQLLRNIEEQDLEVCFLNKHLYQLIFFDNKLEKKIQELKLKKNVKSDLVVLLKHQVTTLEAFYNDQFNPDIIKLPKQLYEQSRLSFLTQNYGTLPQNQKLSKSLLKTLRDFGQEKVIVWQTKLAEKQILTRKQFFNLSADEAQQLKFPKYKFTSAREQYQFQKQQEKKKNGIMLQEIPQFQQPQLTEVERIKKQCRKPYQTNNLTVYPYPQLKQSHISIEQGLKTIIFIGQTGSGKSSLVDFWLNYHFGVQFGDNYRFSLYPQQLIQTQDIKTYYIQAYNGNPALRIIDTPEFDSNEEGDDSQIAEKIKEYFRIEIDRLTTICFVMQASLERLTNTQNQLLNLMISMYGTDVIKNFFFMFNSSDSDQPLARNALLFSGDQNHKASPLASYTSQLQEPWYLTINSEAYLITNCTNQGITQQDLLSTQHQWEHAIKSFNTFVELKLNKIVDIKLAVAQDIEELKNYILQLRPKIIELLNMLQNNYTRYQEVLKLTEEQIGKKQKIVETRHKTTKNYLTNEFATVCIICNHTCHYPCGVNDDNKQGCSSMSSDYCTACEKRCHYNQHRNAQYILNHESYEVEVEVDALKEQFEDDDTEKSAKEQIMIGLKQECLDLEIKCMENQVLLWEQVNQLNQKGSSQYLCETMSEYLDIMIKEEDTEKKSGLIERIGILKNMKEVWNLIEQKQGNSRPIKYTKEEITNALQEKGGIFKKDNF